MKKRRILITGVTGFIGANLARRFIELNADLYAFKRPQSNLWRIKDIGDRIVFYDVDLINADLIAKTVQNIAPEIIIHCAVYGGSRQQSNMREIISTNYLGTINLLNAFIHGESKLFINTGSSSEYGTKNAPMKETDLLEPISDYGVAKAAATLYCQKTAKITNKSIITLRLFSPYGYYEGTSRLFPCLLKALINNQSPSLANPKSVRDFCFIEDVVNAYCKIVDDLDWNKISGQIFNVASGEQKSVQEVLAAACQVFNFYPEVEWGAGPACKNEPTFWQADTEKTKNVIGWEAKTSLQNGLIFYIEWFKKHRELYDETI